MMLNKLRSLNDVPIYSVFDSEFKTFGKVISEFDMSELISYMKTETQIPETEGNIYIPSVAEMENTKTAEEIKNCVYGGLNIQIGYCNGRNRTYNGFEYHKCSEINVAVTDLLLVLGHSWDIEGNKYYVGNETVFFVPEGTAIEMYQTTLHLSPIRVTDEGFKTVVVLLKDTNTPLDKEKCNIIKEEELLLQKNKWILSHKDREPLVKQGAHIGLMGENKKLNY